MIEVYYRYEDVRYAALIDEWGVAEGPGRLEVKLREYPVIKKTKKGAWINARYGRRFVLDNVRKTYACPTIAEARKSFIARKTRQAGIYRARLRQAEEALTIINKTKEFI